MGENQVAEQILLGCRKAGIALEPPQAELLSIHVELMLQWNQRTNLTRITRLEDIIAQHIIDSIAPAAFLPERGRALDVGTGAGFPGVPLKIAHPGLHMTLLDAGHRKVSFLKFLLTRMNLKDIQALTGKWETWAKTWADEGVGYDLVTMRAVRIEAAHLSQLANPLLRPGGVFAWWAGPGSGRQAWETLAAMRVPHLTLDENHFYEIPGIERPRMLMVWRKDQCGAVS